MFLFISWHREDLAKPASNLYLHNLTGILETAIRATNAQFDAADILRRLDVRLLDVSPGDTGWDVFSLEYRVDGPIRTVSLGWKYPSLVCATKISEVGNLFLPFCET